jgi:hypothetical protein
MVSSIRKVCLSVTARLSCQDASGLTVRFSHLTSPPLRSKKAKAYSALASRSFRLSTLIVFRQQPGPPPPPRAPCLSACLFRHICGKTPEDILTHGSALSSNFLHRGEVLESFARWQAGIKYDTISTDEDIIVLTHLFKVCYCPFQTSQREEAPNGNDSNCRQWRSPRSRARSH